MSDGEDALEKYYENKRRRLEEAEAAHMQPPGVHGNGDAVRDELDEEDDDLRQLRAAPVRAPRHTTHSVAQDTFNDVLVQRNKLTRAAAVAAAPVPTLPPPPPPSPALAATAPPPRKAPRLSDAVAAASAVQYTSLPASAAASPPSQPQPARTEARRMTYRTLKSAAEYRKEILSSRKLAENLDYIAGLVEAKVNNKRDPSMIIKVPFAYLQHADTMAELLRLGYKIRQEPLPPDCFCDAAPHECEAFLRGLPTKICMPACFEVSFGDDESNA